MVVSELRGEKIDIIPWNTEPARFVAKALSPARVREVYIDDDSRDATVVVPDDQLALAIGKEGLNARLAARLTGWKVDIVSDTEFAQQEAEAAFGGEGDVDFSGRCAALLANGKRCPNTSLPGSRFCGVAAHQELARSRRRPASTRPARSLPPPRRREEEADAAEAENGEVDPEQAAAVTATPQPIDEADAIADARERRSSPSPPSVQQEGGHLQPDERRSARAPAAAARRRNRSCSGSRPSTAS